MRTMIGAGIRILILALGAVATVNAEDAKKSYAAPKTFDAFRLSAPDEITLARSAAPPSISNDAEILTLGSESYETAVKGKNGFVCLVMRAWANKFGDGEFWNPKIRSPLCVNAAAAKSVLPVYLERTRWVLSGVSSSEMITRTKAEVAKHSIPDPLPGSMSYMMSKQGYINDDAYHWYSHVMFFMPRTDGASWGANSPGVPMFSDNDDLPPTTTFFVLVPKWSDGSLVSAEKP
jgi:hypothetical protein